MTRLNRSLTLVLTLSVEIVSHAADLLDNTTAGISTGGSSAISSTSWAGFAFNVGATPYTIDSVNVVIGLAAGGQTTGELTVRIYASSAGKPTGPPWLRKRSLV